MLVAASLIELNLKTMEVKLEGTSSLIVHKFNSLFKHIHYTKAAWEKAKEYRETLKGKMEECEQAFYRLPDGKPGFPIIAFKDVVVTAAESLGKKMPKMKVRQSFYCIKHPVGGELTEILFPEDCPPAIREHEVCIGKKEKSSTYQPEFKKWGVKLNLEFNACVISPEQIVSLLNFGGYSEGVGRLRGAGRRVMIREGGDHGRFRVVDRFSWEK